jgi:predicted nucleic acid-binding protein
MKDKPGLYCETSYWRRLIDTKSPLRRRWTRELHDVAPRRFRLWTSKLVLTELRDAPEPDRTQAIRKLMDSRAKCVTTTWKIGSVTEELLHEGGWSENLLADCAHLAYTIVGRMAALVTWNMNDLACPVTRRVVSEVCRRHEWPVPLIGTPEEVLEWVRDGIL